LAETVIRCRVSAVRILFLPDGVTRRDNKIPPLVNIFPVWNMGNLWKYNSGLEKGFRMILRIMTHGSCMISQTGRDLRESISWWNLFLY